MKKLFIIAITVLFVTQNALARDKYDNDNYAESDIYGLSTEKEPVPSGTFSVELGAGQMFEAGISIRKNFGRYFSWNVVNLKYALNYGDSYLEDYNHYHDNDYDASENNMSMFSLTSGFRVYTPKIRRSHVRFFLDGNFGYSLSARKEYCEHNSYSYLNSNGEWYKFSTSINHEQTKTKHHIVVDASVGLYVSKSVSVSAGFRYLGLGHRHYQRDIIAGQARIAIDF